MLQTALPLQSIITPPQLSLASTPLPRPSQIAPPVALPQPDASPRHSHF